MQQLVGFNDGRRKYQTKNNNYFNKIFSAMKLMFIYENNLINRENIVDVYF